MSMNTVWWVDFFTESVIHFLSMRNTMADLWHPLGGGGISISNIGDKRFCFRFYNEIDLERVYDGCPWFFNNHLLLLHKLRNGEDPLQVPLEHTMMWVQIHDLPPGLMSEPMARQFGKFLGEFLEYDSKLILLGRKQFMRLKVWLDVRQPLKRKKKVALGGDKCTYVRF
ncbi:hypothetical protein like AT3G31430 [Hibiscus trionum]|uniref:DUF4283 domain-containing protein n=1 Tax=Hibiscus trionum TaxID=183268 RepID=A0A9W7MLL9_HIBTR|nr:hypothetical protein like AT3G31430 [Hibiscus trionum]